MSENLYTEHRTVKTKADPHQKESGMVIHMHRLQEKLWSARGSDLTPENSDRREALQVDSE